MIDLLILSTISLSGSQTLEIFRQHLFESGAAAVAVFKEKRKKKPKQYFLDATEMTVIASSHLSVLPQQKSPPCTKADGGAVSQLPVTTVGDPPCTEGTGGELSISESIPRFSTKCFRRRSGQILGHCIFRALPLLPGSHAAKRFQFASPESTVATEHAQFSCGRQV